MTRLTAASHRPAAARRHAFIQIAIGLLVVSTAGWNFDAWLLVRLRLAADDAFAYGDPERPGLLLDGSEELRAFPPTRLAGFVGFPAPQIRSAACLSLSERENERDPQAWVGVAPKLLHALTSDANPVARECARAAVVNLPVVPAQDLGAVQSFVEENGGESLRSVQTTLVAKTVRDNPDRLPWAVAYYERWLESDDVAERRAGFDQLMALAPHAPATIAAFRNLVDAGDPDGIASGDGRRLLLTHPKLVEECWRAAPAGRWYLLACAVADFRTALNQGVAQYHARCGRQRAPLWHAAQTVLRSWLSR